MKALVFDKELGEWEKTIGFEKVDIPKPTLDEKVNLMDKVSVIIKVHYAGVCGSDRGIWFRKSFKEQILGSIAAEGKTKRTIGHEFFGEIVEIGSEANRVSLSPLNKGDFVTCESHVVCNKCYQCLMGEKHVCTNEKILGISHEGGFAEYVKVPAHIVWKTDTSKIRPELGAIQEPFGNAVHAASKVPIAGKTIAIFGLGPIGLFLTLIAKGLGAETIIGIDPNPKSQEMALRLGIDYCLAPTKIQDKEKPWAHDEATVSQIINFTNGIGVDVSFEMSGINSAFNSAMFATRRGGDIIGFGIQNTDFVLENYNRFIVRGLTIHAVIGRKLFETWETTKRLLENPKNGISENIWNIILEGGKDIILPIDEYNKQIFEKKMLEHPKILLQF